VKGTRILAAAAGLAVLMALPALPQPAATADVPYWPSEQEQQLRRVETEILHLQRRLFAARQHSRKKRAKRLEKRFRKLKEEQAALLGLRVD